MMIDFLIKTALLTAGITIDSVVFSRDGECINIEYSQKGKSLAKTITFREIEAYFRTAPARRAGSQEPSAGPPGPSGLGKADISWPLPP